MKVKNILSNDKIKTLLSLGIKKHIPIISKHIGSNFSILDYIIESKKVLLFYDNIENHENIFCFLLLKIAISNNKVIKRSLVLTSYILEYILSIDEKKINIEKLTKILILRIRNLIIKIKNSSLQINKKYFYNSINKFNKIDKTVSICLSEAIENKLLLIPINSTTLSNFSSFKHLYSITGTIKNSQQEIKLKEIIGKIVIAKQETLFLPQILHLIKENNYYSNNTNIILIAKKFDKELLSTLKINNYFNNNQLITIEIDSLFNNINCLNYKNIIENSDIIFINELVKITVLNGILIIPINREKKEKNSLLLEYGKKSTNYKNLLERNSFLINSILKKENISYGAMFSLSIENATLEKKNTKEEKISFFIMEYSLKKLTKSIVNNYSNITNISEDYFLENCIFESLENNIICLKNTTKILDKLFNIKILLNA